MSSSFRSFERVRDVVRLLAGRFLSKFSVVSMIAVAMAVAVQVLVLSVMHGFRADLMEKFIGLNPHLRIAAPASDTIAPTVLGALDVVLLPSVEGEGIMTAAGDVETGIRIRGVTPETLAHMTSLAWALPQGTDPVSMLTPSPLRGEGRGEGDIPVVAIGSELAAQIGATPDGGRTVTLIAPLGQLTPAGDLAPNRMTVKIGGLFKSGLYELDQSLVLMDIAAARQILGPQATEGFWGYVPDPMRVQQAARVLRDQYPELRISTWQEENAALFGALKLERIVMTTLLVLVVGIAATGIIGVLIMTGLARQQDVGVLLALGATASQVRQIFVLHGAIIGAIGSALGILLAIGGGLWISRGGIPLPESLYLHTLPVTLSASGILIIGFGACVLTTLASWYPTRELHQAVVIRWLKGE